MRKVLLVFDFDHTVIDANSDTFINSLLPDGEVPKSVKQVMPQGWTKYMQALFNHMHEKNVRKDDLLACLNKIECTPGMKRLLTEAPKDKVDCIIISDANTIFINSILKHQQLHEAFDAIYTNLGSFDESGLLRISEYHHQDWCSLSAENLCKGSILTDYVGERKKQGVEYSHIGYVGDGSNDFCPSLCLRERDAVFPRLHYRLVTLIDKKQKEGVVMTAPLHPWDHAEKIQDVLLQWCDGLKEDSALEEPRLLPVRPK